ncbi:MAG: anhydro-N-acetylmuramic acid kinase [bacterium]
MTSSHLTLSELLAKPRRKTIGLMSGTSMDGLDIALCDVEIGTGQLQNLASQTADYPAALQSALVRVVESGSAKLTELVALSAAWGDFATKATEQFLSERHLKPQDVDLIGSHGQTVAHLADPLEIAGGAYRGSLQIGDAEIVAKRLGIVTVSDFRSGDLAVGGSGAPLTPIYHQQRFAVGDRIRLVVNIGGIANVTLLEGLDKCLATDTGPGNCLIDYLTQHHLNQPYDESGEEAATGTIDQELSSRLQEDKLFKRPLPCSFDRAEVLHLAERVGLLNPADPATLASRIATVTELTAWSIHRQTQRLSESAPTEVLVCGGGFRNRTLMKHLRNYFADSIVTGTDKFGSDPDFVEAECFAWLANLTIEGRAGNLPQVTGADRAVVLGKISLP